METTQIQSLLQNYNLGEFKKDRRTERGELMREFLENLNAERGKKFPPLSYARMGVLLQGIPTKDLYAFLSMCKDRQRVNGSFSKYFWWALRPQ